MIRRLTALATLVAVALAAGACGRTSPTHDRPSVQGLIAGGGKAGIYYGYGQELAAVLNRELGADVVVLETAGSVENLQLVGSGDALFGVTAADAASDAVAGHPPFDGPIEAQALARLYDDVVHLVVPASSSITEIDDLTGHRVSLGAPGSGTVLIARRLLQAAEVDTDGVMDAGLGIDASIAGLRAGELDGFFWSGGLPTPGVAELAADMPLRLVPLGELEAAMRDAHGPAYRQAILPHGVYEGVASTQTLAVPNFLVTHATTDVEVVATVLDLLFANRVSMATRVPAVGLLDQRTAIFTAPVDLHPGAIRHYREAKGIHAGYEGPLPSNPGG